MPRIEASERQISKHHVFHGFCAHRTNWAKAFVAAYSMTVVKQEPRVLYEFNSYPTGLCHDSSGQIIRNPGNPFILHKLSAWYGEKGDKMTIA